jgi:phosphoglucomutase/phosphomannomutase
LRIAQVRDYEQAKLIVPGRGEQPLDGPRGDLIFLDFAKPGNCVAVRPSGTEPKVKFYLFAYEPPEQIAHLDDTKAELAARLAALEAALSTLAGSDL